MWHSIASKWECQIILQLRTFQKLNDMRKLTKAPVLLTRSSPSFIQEDNIRILPWHTAIQIFMAMACYKKV